MIAILRVAIAARGPIAFRCRVLPNALTEALYEWRRRGPANYLAVRRVIWF
jgi:hypothetical protein